ncbi:MAG: NADH-quinone oxidoreductase subunit NuoH [Spirochaetes bacterium]|nr:NADH-quinone oxidoreductase subunit NuoH [Spirochaetota bacterium]
MNIDIDTIIFDVLIPVIKIIVMILFPMIMVMVMLWVERRGIAFLQERLGPNRVGFQGILQPIADTIKMLFKEDIIQRQSDKLIFNIAPVVVLATSLLAFCFIPVGMTMSIGSYNLTFWVAESPVGLLITLGISSLSVLGIVFAGWASNSKYSLLGGLRSVVQLLSYEIPIGLTVLTVVLASGSMNFIDIVNKQNEMGIWFAFMMPVSCVVFWIAAMAECNRSPFDIVEADSELVAGFHTEYSGIKFGYFFMAEYAHMVLVSSLMVVFFFGGGLPIFPNVEFLWFLHYIPGFVWYFIKIMFFLYLFVWIRGTFPRYRFDGLIRLVWKWLVPLSLLNLIVVAIIRMIV